MALIDSVIVFLVNLLVGGLGIYAGTKLVTGKADYGYSIITALLGAVIWGVTSFFFGFIPLIGPALVFLAWLALIKARIEGGWIDSLLVAVIAWFSVILIISLLTLVGLSPGAIGIPGV